MIAVVVEFETHTEHVDRFRDAVLKQAENSLVREESCRQFDVCVNDEKPNKVFLYETYDSRDAFDGHLASEHFKEFDALTKPWIANKKVAVWEIVEA